MAEPQEQASGPTLEDAIELLTDPANMQPHAGREFAEVRTGKVNRQLQQQGASEDAARLLILQAAERPLGGGISVEQRPGGLRADGPRSYSQFRAWVRTDRLR